MAKLIITEINTLEGELQSLAVENWNEFCRLVGPEAMTTAKICALSQKGKTVRQIANRLKLPATTVFNRCKKCSAS